MVSVSASCCVVSGGLQNSRNQDSGNCMVIQVLTKRSRDKRRWERKRRSLNSLIVQIRSTETATGKRISPSKEQPQDHSRHNAAWSGGRCRMPNAKPTCSAQGRGPCCAPRSDVPGQSPPLQASAPASGPVLELDVNLGAGLGETGRSWGESAYPGRHVSKNACRCSIESVTPPSGP